MNNFGSPRVGDKLFSEHFDKLLQVREQAYRIGNDKDIVARIPRTVRALSVDCDHCGSTVLVIETTQDNVDKVLRIEEESDDR
jgi:hypothetical protein